MKHRLCGRRHEGRDAQGRQRTGGRRQCKRRCVLVSLEDLAGLCQVINLLVRISREVVEEGLGRLCEDDALPPACWHCGRGSTAASVVVAGREGERRRGGGEGAEEERDGRLEGRARCWMSVREAEAVIFARVCFPESRLPQPCSVSH